VVTANNAAAIAARALLIVMNDIVINGLDRLASGGSGVVRRLSRI
jgi:hypothetical protein